MSQLAGYIGPISTAMWVFPFVALLFTVPYVISSYRRYGAVLFFRALVVYSFIFYMMCVYFLAILPPHAAGCFMYASRRSRTARGIHQ